MNNALWFIVDAIITGTPVAAICLVLFRVLSLKSGIKPGTNIVAAISILILANAFIYLLAIAMQLFISYYWGGEYEQYTFINRFWGQYWWAMFIMVVFRFLLLPQIFWFRKLRRQLRYPASVVLIWLFITVAIHYLEFSFGSGFTVHYELFFSKLGFYFLLLGGVYWLIRRKSRQTISNELA